MAVHLSGKQAHYSNPGGAAPHFTHVGLQSVIQEWQNTLCYCYDFKSLLLARAESSMGQHQNAHAVLVEGGDQRRDDLYACKVRTEIQSVIDYLSSNFCFLAGEVLRKVAGA